MKQFVLILLFPLLSFSQTIQYTMPFEDAEHEGTWLQWPHDNTYGNGWKSENEPAFIEMVAALESGENVHIIVYDASEQLDVEQTLTNASISLTNVDFYIHQNDDYWVRDNGPIFVYDNNNNNLAILDFDFNGWGNDAPYALCNQIPSLIATDLNIPVVDLSDMVFEGGAIEIDGNGSALMTRSSVTASDRNPNLTETQIEDYLTTYLGITNFIWLDGSFGGSQDITDQHIDGFAKFVDANTIVTMNNADLWYWYVSTADIATLNAATDANGVAYNIVNLPLTQNNVFTTSGSNTYSKGSYVNYYVANDAVLVPVYNDANDSIALGIIQGLYPTKTAVGIDCRDLFNYGGMVHCVTQQQPIALNTTSIKEQTNKPANFRITDVLGREVLPTKNIPLIYLFEDGTVTKQLIIE
jgi:agmatine deiminase